MCCVMPFYDAIAVAYLMRCGVWCGQDFEHSWVRCQIKFVGEVCVWIYLKLIHYMMYVYVYSLYLILHISVIFLRGFQLKPSWIPVFFLSSLFVTVTAVTQAVHIWMMLLEISRLGTRDSPHFTWGCFNVSHNGSMGRVWYICLHEWLIFMVNVDKYTSPMDPMGIENKHPGLNASVE